MIFGLFEGCFSHCFITFCRLLMPKHNVCLFFGHYSICRKMVNVFILQPQFCTLVGYKGQVISDGNEVKQKMYGFPKIFDSFSKYFFKLYRYIPVSGNSVQEVCVYSCNVLSCTDSQWKHIVVLIHSEVLHRIHIQLM